MHTMTYVDVCEGTSEPIEIKICRTRVWNGATEDHPEPWWGPGDSLMLPCKGGTVLEVREVFRI